jgi:hypothetical protein
VTYMHKFVTLNPGLIFRKEFLPYFTAT